MALRYPVPGLGPGVRGSAPQLLFVAPAGGQNVTLNQVEETDVAQALALKTKTKTLGQNTQTELAQPIKAVRFRAIGQISETDTAQTLALRTKSKTLGQISESDSSQTIGRSKTKAAGQNTETDSVQSLTGTHQRTLGQPQETDTASSVRRPVSDLKDNFDDNTYDSTKWPTKSASTNETGGQLVQNPSGTFSLLRSANVWSLLESSVVVELAQNATGAGVYSSLRIYPNAAANFTDRIEMFYQASDGTLRMQAVIGGVTLGAASLTYNSATHKWWRIRETGGVIYWDTSSTGTSWTQRNSWSWTMSPTTVTVGLETFATAGVTLSSIWDNFNLAPTGISQPVGQTDETDSAQALANKTKSKTLGQITETDTSQSSGRLKSKSIGVATRTTFLVDSFTDTNNTDLSAHTGETGATWTLHPSYSSGAAQIAFNQLRNVTTYAYYASGTPSSSEYTVTAVLNAKQTYVDNRGIGIAGRMDTATNTMYLAQYAYLNSRWELFKGVSGTFTSLGTYSQTLVDGESYTLTLEITNGAKRLIVDGIERISSTDNAITGSGTVGVRGFGAFSSVQGLLVDSISAYAPAFVSATTDFSTPLARLKSKTLGQVAETDESQHVSYVRYFAVGQATETDSAQAISVSRTAAVNQTAETDLSQAVGKTKSKTLGQNTETDAAQPTTSNKTKSLNQTTEADSAQNFSATRSTIVAQSTSSETAQSFTHTKSKTLGQAEETDATQPISESKQIGQALETDTSQTVTRLKSQTIGQSTETGFAQSITRVRSKTLGQTSETNDAQAIQTAGAYVVNQAQETDAALSVTASKTKALGESEDTETAQTVTAVRFNEIGQTTEAGTAQPFVAIHSRELGQATETDSADIILPEVGTPVGLVEETDEAQSINRVKTAVLGTAIEADSAEGITRVKSGFVGTNQETDVSQPVVFKRSLTLGQAVESDTAQSVTFESTTPLGQVIETDAAQGVARLKRKTLGQAIETDAPQPILVRRVRSFPVGQATTQDTSQPVFHVKRRGVAQVFEVDTSLPFITSDVAAPILLITQGPTNTYISTTSGVRTTEFDFEVNEDIVEWKVKAVNHTAATHNEGVVVGNTYGSQNTTGTTLTRETPQHVLIDARDAKAAAGGVGTTYLKVYAKDIWGIWTFE
jgi:hypothetical protein